MTPGDWLVAYLGTGAIMIMLMFVLTAKIAYKDGHRDGRDYERNRRSTRAIRAQSAPPTRLLQPAATEQPWPYHGHGRHSVWAQRLTVRTDTVSFAGGPATVPVSHRGVSDSGELRALVAGNDRYIENMRREEAAWRGQLVT